MEQDADVVASFSARSTTSATNHMDQDLRGKAELLIAKHRNGPVGTVELAFQDKYPRFRNMAQSYRERDAPPPPQPDDFGDNGDDPIDPGDEF